MTTAACLFRFLVIITAGLQRRLSPLCAIRFFERHSQSTLTASLLLNLTEFRLSFSLIILLAGKV